MSSRARSRVRAAWLLLRVAAGGVALARLARGARRPPPLAPTPGWRPPPGRSVTVVVPARDEAARIGPLLAALRVDPQVTELVVVDDESTDGTPDLARAAGARVVAGRPLPPGWVGKPWALQQGLEAAAGHWLVTLDADVEPRPGLVGALVGEAEAGGWDWLSVGGRFAVDRAAERLRHPALLATLVLRLGPPGRSADPGRQQANGQCTVTRRAPFVAAGGYGDAAGHLTDDVALARALARRGWRVGFCAAGPLLDVRLRPAEWSRSLALADVTPPARRAADLAVLWVAQALPLPRLLTGRGDALDVALLAARLGLLAGTAASYARRGTAYWLSPLTDVAAVAAVTRSALRPPRAWRGRSYPPARSGARSGT